MLLASAPTLFLFATTYVSIVLAHRPLGHLSPREQHKIYLRELHEEKLNVSKRQAVSTNATQQAVSLNATPTAGGAIQTAPAKQPNGMVIPPLANITSGMASQPTNALFSTATSSQPVAISGAPPIPSWSYQTGAWPALDLPPPTDSDEVKQWLSELDFSGVPDLNTTTGDCIGSPQAAADKSRCWWTCGGCTRETDVSTCGQKYDYGLTYDDGPSPYTPDLLDFLHANGDLKATFFVVGSRVISRPDILKLEYAAGHQISAHTWSYTPLTTQTNAEIVAEMMWTLKSIKAVIGVTPNTCRAPYGDIDDRVRGVLELLGLTPIQWTGVANGVPEFDTNDWKIPAGQATGLSSIAAFDQILANAAKMDSGFITLTHDLFPASVDLSVGYVLPSVINSTSPKYNLQSVINCLGNPLSDAYVETAVNTTTASIANASSSKTNSTRSALASNVQSTQRSSTSVSLNGAGGKMFLESVSTSVVVGAICAWSLVG